MQFLKYAFTAYRAYRGDPEAAGQIVAYLFSQVRAREMAGLDISSKYDPNKGTQS